MNSTEIIETNISVVIGSWWSYYACNSRCYGSKWLDLSKYSCWSEIEQELRKQGFLIDSFDSELFVQDIEGFPAGCTNWADTNPEIFFELLLKSGVLNNKQKHLKMFHFIQSQSFYDWEDLVHKYAQDWDKHLDNKK